jgi:DNA-binding transcriptional LysR family regulator
MDTRFLESFVQVVRLGSLAEAARRLNLTPAAVAQRIKALEEELATPLLARVGRTVKPTAAGNAVYTSATALLRALRELKGAALLDIVAGELRLGAVSTAMTGILPELLSRVNAQHPDVAFFVAPGTSQDLYRRVATGELDAAIIVQPPFPIPKECDWQTVRAEPLVLIAGGGTDLSDPHRLLATEPFLRYDRNHWGGRLAERYLRHCDIVPKDRFELDALEAIAVMVDRGLGISLVPDWAPPWPEGLSLERWYIPDDQFTRRIGLVWNRSSLNLRLVDALVQTLEAASD